MSLRAWRRALSGEWAVGASMLLCLSCTASPSGSAGEAAGTSSSAIVNGFDSVASQNFVVLIVHPTNDAGTQFYECSGALVAPNLVLTARHCVSQTSDIGFTCDSNGVGSSGGDIGPDFDPMTLEVYMGLTRPPAFASPDAYGTQVFHDTATNLCNHDLALIALDVALEVPSSEIAALRLEPPPSNGELITAVGWGVSTTSMMPETRQQRTDISILEVGPYTDSQGNDVAPNEFDDGESICEGDSGSPALDSNNAVIGVASRGGNNMPPEAGNLAASCVGSQTINYYSSVSAFSAVILDAFKVMAETPKLSGGGSLGATCSTSIECLSGVCVGTAGNGYCSEGCASSPCAAGYTCGMVSGQEVCEQDPPSSGGCSAAPSRDGTLSGLGVALGSLLFLGTRRRRRRPPVDSPKPG